MSPFLPPNDPQRLALHNEVHARPSANVNLPALITFVAVLNEGVARSDEWDMLRQLPGQHDLDLAALEGNFLRLQLPGYTLKWERHTEFTRYSIVQALPDGAGLARPEPPLAADCLAPQGWLARLPGTTIAAIELAMMNSELADPTQLMQAARSWLGGGAVVASQMGQRPTGNGHSWVLTDFEVRADGFERMLVLCEPGTTVMRAGRISQRLLEFETYRLMALRGLPVAKALGPMLGEAESMLATITARMEGQVASDPQLLEQLVALAARIERATAQHSYRFAASQAYFTLVGQRLAELREKPIPGTQTLGEFMQRRLSPALATVAATAQRMASLSERVARTSALLRTRVDIATELQNQQLLAQLTRGQALQLRLQSTVEGLSIAAITYYVVSLLLYGAKAAKAAGLPVQPEVAVGALIPLVLWAVWRTLRGIHAQIKL
jgi:uncharacterized membrane-anchored protein